MKEFKKHCNCFSLPLNLWKVLLLYMLEKARRTYLKYKIINELLQSKYNMQFDEFSKSKFMEEPSFEVEQDFFDWDMAITGMGDMVSEIKHLESML